MPGVENVVADALSQPLAVTAVSVAVSGFRHLKSLGVRHILVITLAVSGFRHLKSSGVDTQYCIFIITFAVSGFRHLKSLALYMGRLTLKLSFYSKNIPT